MQELLRFSILGEDTRVWHGRVYRRSALVAPYLSLVVVSRDDPVRALVRPPVMVVEIVPLG